MSYRAFKRLLGETSLERKCRFLFGAFTLLLISSSFWMYAWQTESLAYDQIPTVCRQKVGKIVDDQIATGCSQGVRSEPKKIAEARAEFRQRWETHWPVPFE